MTEDTIALLYAFSAALGAGLLVGLVRERAHATHATAGLRTHALVALAAAVAAWLGTGVLLVALAAVALLAAMSYHASHEHDPGLTGEVALVATALLGALAVRSPGIATGLAVVVAVLLFAKRPLHTLTRELLSEREVFDGLFLLASALVVLPLLPDRGFGPYGALNPRTLWLLVVLVMAVGAVGHVALRVIGNRWGLAVSGFFAGYVSSTAAVLGFGQRAKESPQLMRSAVGAALLANLASLTLAVPVLGALSPALVAEQRWILAAVGAVLLAGGLLGLHAGREDAVAPPTAQTRMFRFGHALGFAVLVGGMVLLAAALNRWIGAGGAMAAAVIAAAAELHASIATLGSLRVGGAIDPAQGRWLMVGLLAASLGAKSVLAVASGGRGYGLRVAAGLLAALAAGIAAAALAPG
ncbi:MgtC/SapB family protein [Luteimonas sp. Sa2BVA3]|uniref:MgtC/SapB family protein n=1 Tax=Luteimonas colneyensis TaxID=2762230 RepID=A0ABR8UIE3_9GAMM|nr:DUF4010 domain-containing protein [Luteimonas colneyensis]MBD7987424.1 MgtC/SapB family protein [Luteimonas colneyensis]